MPDDLTRRTPEDPKKVNIHQRHEIRYWTNKLGISEEKLVAVVEAVGPLVSDIEACLQREKIKSILDNNKI